MRILLSHYKIITSRLSSEAKYHHGTTPATHTQKPKRVKGSRQKLSSGFCSLRGGWFPPIPLRKIPLKSRFLRSKNSIFCPFSYILSPFWSIIWPFWSIFNLIQYKNIIFSLFRKKIFPKSLADFPLRGEGGCTPPFR